MTDRPTDAEAYALWLSIPVTGAIARTAGAFARAVLSRWGTPPPAVAREPLTPEQIMDEASHHGFIGSREMLVKFVRDIEAAHGIQTGENT